MCGQNSHEPPGPIHLPRMVVLRINLQLHTPNPQENTWYTVGTLNLIWLYHRLAYIP